MNSAQLVLLLANWFLLIIIMLLTLKSIAKVQPFVEKIVIARTLWYLYVAIGYSLISVTIFTSYVIWYFGEAWGFLVFLMTWMLMITIYVAHKKIDDASIKTGFKLK